MFDAWERAGVRSGSRVLDVGAGPGYAAVDLAERVGANGQVLAVERSPRFAAFARERARILNHQNLSVVELDLMEQPIPDTSFDVAWCRWVACVVSSPALLLRRIYDALRPKGTVVFHEYVDYASWRIVPARPNLDAFVAAAMASWRAMGGEPDAARFLPSLLRSAGFDIRSARPLVFALRPTDDMWQWLVGFVRADAPRLHELGRLDADSVRRILEDVDEVEEDPAALMVTPMVLEIVAQRA